MKRLFLMFSALVILIATLSLAAQQKKDADVVAALTKLENDSVKADLANDMSFFQTYLADDYTSGTSRGTWYTKQSTLANMKDTKNNKTNTEKYSDIKVRVYGDVAIVTYKNSYDSLIEGQHYTRTVIVTDTVLRQGGTWKFIASHASQAAN